ncbi:NrfD/PsrC family molybdoenzyme membrane anchor subunit [Pseudodesulfovibrio pelocollis]|uniref:NrfD/PsrC family molybdoenzyme membrane anchor subunit n=1 Tax=Pseudodesulfovibrio pelocollis TaxID=3051432 RepID=UPI00255AA916|nr:NrfD/PsrC family molybdoenzyme membrane anchor subunit [Pseudodesulfovibrio sp. SB368]
MSTNKTFSIVWTALLAIGLILGLFTAGRIVTGGLGIFNTDNTVFWGLPMAGYLFFGLTAAGLTLLSSLPTVFGQKHLYPVAKRAAILALATLLTGLMCKGLDLGPFSTLVNTLALVYSPNFTSPIWWMAILYMFYFAFVTFKFLAMHRGNWHDRGGVATAVGALMLSFFSYLSLSVVFGTVEARLGFMGFTMGIYFLVTALASGLAALLLASVAGAMLGRGATETEASIRSDLSKYLGVALGASLVVFLLRILRAYASDVDQMAGFKYMTGTLSFGVELWVGLCIPILLLLIPTVRTTLGGQFVVALMALVGMFAGRYEQLLSGNVQPMGVQAEYIHGFSQYSPSLSEWGVILLALSLTLTIYTLGVRYLRLEAMPD